MRLKGPPPEPGKMTIDRELRSSKRQKVGRLGMSDSSSKAEPSEEAADLTKNGEDLHRQMHNGIENAAMENVPQANTTPMEENLSERNEIHGSGELYSEQNDKVADTLLSLKDMSSSDNKQNESARPYNKPHSYSLEESDCNAGPEKNDEDYSTQELKKLENYLHTKGLVLGDGWNVHMTYGIKSTYKSFISPDKKRFRSMIEVARSIKKNKGSNSLEDQENTQVSLGGRVDSSCYMDAVGPEAGVNQNSGIHCNAEEIPEKENGTQKGNKGHTSVALPSGKENEQESSKDDQHIGRQKSTNDMIQKAETNNAVGSMVHESKRRRSKLPWLSLLQNLLKSPNISADSVKEQIKKALDLDPPENVSQMLQSLMTSNTTESDWVKSFPESLLSLVEENHEDLIEEMKSKQMDKCMPNDNVVSVHGTHNAAEGGIVNGSAWMGDHLKPTLSSEAITSGFKNVWKNITSADKFAMLFKLIHGNFPGSRPHDIFDSGLIEVRMNAGTYGTSPELFLKDVQEMWNKVRALAEEMIVLANDLSEFCQLSYDKEFSGLVGETVEACNNVSRSNKTSKSNVNMLNGSKENIQQTDEGNLHGVIGSKTVIHAIESQCMRYMIRPDSPLEKQSELQDDNRPQCRSCGQSENNEAFKFCVTCNIPYHVSCISNVTERIPEIWCCSTCSSSKAEQGQVYSVSHGRSERRIKNSVNTPSKKYLAGQESHHKLAYRLREASKSSSFGDPKDINRVSTAVNSNSNLDAVNRDGDHKSFDQFIPLNGSNVEMGEIKCKICLHAERDDDTLIKCSNENCLHKYYHLRCMKPPLASVPPPDWFCPSCLCRACFIDEHDEDIVLCDGCDNAYHTYCLKPPLPRIPESDWFCPLCPVRTKKKKSRRTNNASHIQPLGRRGASKTRVNDESVILRKVESVKRNRVPKGIQKFRLKNGSILENDNAIKHEEEPASLMQSENENSPEENDVKAHSDASLEHTTDKFMVRVRPNHMAKYAAEMDLKEAGKRKRKCSEPRRSEV